MLRNMELQRFVESEEENFYRPYYTSAVPDYAANCCIITVAETLIKLFLLPLYYNDSKRMPCSIKSITSLPRLFHQYFIHADNI